MSPARSSHSFVFGRFGTTWDEGELGGPSVVVCTCHLVALRVVEALCAFTRLSFSTFVTWSGESSAVEDGWMVNGLSSCGKCWVALLLTVAVSSSGS